MNKIEARRLIISCQRFNENLPDEKESALAVIKHLGYVQLDTIHVIKRAHEHIIFSRFPKFRSQYLDQLYRERKIFEYWTHAMALLPAESYKYTLSRKQQFNWRYSAYNTKEFKSLTKRVYDRIKAEGALQSSDFKDNHKKSAIWEWKPAKAALETLYHQGKLMVAYRENFRRVYDLTERVVPFDNDDKEPSQQESAQYQINKALNANGVMSLKDLCTTLLFASNDAVIKELSVFLDRGEVELFKLGGIEYYYLRNKSEENLPQKMIFLSPFDNMIINRKRMKLFFDIEYRLECYMPAAKRELGYFVLPILYADEICGFIDLKADRKTEKLVVKNLVKQRKFLKQEEKLLKHSLENFARYNNCKSIENRF